MYLPITLVAEFHQDNYRAVVQYVFVSSVMIYWENIVFDTSKNRNMLCFLSGKLKPQLCKHLGRCPFLCIMNSSLQNSGVQCSTYFFLLLLNTKLITLLYSWASILQVYIPIKKVCPLSYSLNSSFDDIFLCYSGCSTIFQLVYSPTWLDI